MNMEGQSLVASQSTFGMSAAPSIRRALYVLTANIQSKEDQAPEPGCSDKEDVG